MISIQEKAGVRPQATPPIGCQRTSNPLERYFSEDLKHSIFDLPKYQKVMSFIRTEISRISKQIMFEFNDEVTRANFILLLIPILRNLHSNQIISDYLVICDEINNPKEVVTNNQFVADIYIKHSRDSEFIKLTFKIDRVDVTFDQLTCHIPVHHGRL